MSDLSTEFDVMFERSRPRLKRFVDLLLRDIDSADDVMQETCLRASSGFSSLQKPEAFTSWLFRIARNLAYAELNRVKKGVSIDLVDEPELGVDDTESPQQLLGRREVGILLSRAVAELRRNTRRSSRSGSTKDSHTRRLQMSRVPQSMR